MEYVALARAHSQAQLGLGVNAMIKVSLYDVSAPGLLNKPFRAQDKTVL